MYFMSPACNEITRPDTHKGVSKHSPFIIVFFYLIYSVLEIRSWNNGVSHYDPYPNGNTGLNPNCQGFYNIVNQLRISKYGYTRTILIIYLEISVM